MLQALHQAQSQAIYGRKINQLIRLIEQGYQVPSAYIFTADQVKSVLAHVFQVRTSELQPLEKALAYGRQGIDDQRLTIALQASLKDQLPCQFWEGNATYIVRSSGSLEDSRDYAHAGLFDSVAHCHNLADLVEAMKQSIQSIFTPSAQSYYQKNRLEKQNFHFALLIQEQIKADWSGVAFSINPLTGADQEFVLELIQGEGEALVGGQVEPIRCRYLINQACNLDPIPSFISADLQDRIWQILDQLRQTFAYPIDIELCGKGQEIYLLQLRPISPPILQVDQYRWTTTNFRDGGVSAQVATPLIWSLYRDTWSQALGNFVLDQGLWKEAPLPPLIKYHYGRIYWNLGLVKACMAQIPGYQEAEFDDELGVPKHDPDVGYQPALTLIKPAHFLFCL